MGFHQSQLLTVVLLSINCRWDIPVGEDHSVHVCGLLPRVLKRVAHASKLSLQHAVLSIFRQKCYWNRNNQKGSKAKEKAFVQNHRTKHKQPQRVWSRSEMWGELLCTGRAPADSRLGCRSSAGPGLRGACLHLRKWNYFTDVSSFSLCLVVRTEGGSPSIFQRSCRLPRNLPEKFDFSFFLSVCSRMRRANLTDHTLGAVSFCKPPTHVNCFTPHNLASLLLSW